MLASLWPNYLARKHSQREDLHKVRRCLAIMSVLGTGRLALRALEIALLHTKWDRNAYGSIVRLLIGSHTLHLLTCVVDTIVLTVLMFTRHGHGRRFGNTEQSCDYGTFVVAARIPLYVILFLFPRWLRCVPSSARTANPMLTARGRPPRACSPPGLPSAGIHAGPTAWLIATQTFCALVPRGRAHQIQLIPVVALVTAALSLLGGLLSWRGYVTAAQSPRPDATGAGRPHRFVAPIGVGIALLPTAVIVLHGIAAMVFQGCER